MGKYERARIAIESAVEGGAGDGFDRTGMLLALLVSAVDELKRSAGSKVARDALAYEIEQVGGNLDTVFLRSR